MIRISKILLAAFFSIAITSAADAQRAHHRRHGAATAPIVCNRFGCSDWHPAARAQNAARVRHRRVADANGNAVIVGRRPPGCPHDFCGCEASLYLFGKIRPYLNLASNWIRKFPRTAPAPGMAAARNHHVMVLISHAGGSKWLVHDGNSGGGRTREHVRSIKGFVIVDPHGTRLVNKGN